MSTDAPTLGPTPTLPDTALARRLGDRFRAVGLNEANVLKTFGLRDPSQFGQLPKQVGHMRTQEPTPLNVVIRLFMMGVKAPEAAVRGAFGDITLEETIASGLLERDGDTVRARIQLYVNGSTFSANDMPTPGTRQPADAVMGVSGTTLFMSDLCVRKAFGAGLDMGTGCGLLAFRAAAHCTTVTAIDRNPRAAAFTAFSAALNGLSNVEALAGDLFAPVEGRTFDFICSNPPYVISPETRLVYRDSGCTGDEFCQRLAHDAAQRLNPGGWFQMTCDWAHVTGTDPRRRIAGWFEACGCDVLIQRFRTLDPVSYAQQWIRQEAMESGTNDPAELNATLKNWLAYYRDLKIEAISSGLVTLRKLDPWEVSAGRQPWLRADDAPDRLLSPAGHQIQRIFSNQDFLNTSDDRKIMAARFRAAPEIRVRQEFAPQPNGGWSPAESHIRFADGFAQGAPSPSIMMQLVMLCDGMRTGNDALQTMAKAAKKPPEAVGPTVVQALRGLLERGVIVPA